MTVTIGSGPFRLVETSGSQTANQFRSMGSGQLKTRIGFLRSSRQSPGGAEPVIDALKIHDCSYPSGFPADGSKYEVRLAPT